MYPRDPGYDVAVDDRIKRMWQMMEVPSDPQVLVRLNGRISVCFAVRAWIRAYRELCAGTVRCFTGTVPCLRRCALIPLSLSSPLTQSTLVNRTKHTTKHKNR